MPSRKEISNWFVIDDAFFGHKRIGIGALQAHIPAMFSTVRVGMRRSSASALASECGGSRGSGGGGGGSVGVAAGDGGGEGRAMVTRARRARGTPPPPQQESKLSARRRRRTPHALLVVSGGRPFIVGAGQRAERGLSLRIFWYPKNHVVI